MRRFSLPKLGLSFVGLPPSPRTVGVFNQSHLIGNINVSIQEFVDRLWKAKKTSKSMFLSLEKIVQVGKVPDSLDGARLNVPSWNLKCEITQPLGFLNKSRLLVVKFTDYSVTLATNINNVDFLEQDSFINVINRSIIFFNMLFEERRPLIKLVNSK